MHQIGFYYPLHYGLVIDISLFVEALSKLNELEKLTNDLQNQNSIFTAK